VRSNNDVTAAAAEFAAVSESHRDAHAVLKRNWCASVLDVINAANGALAVFLRPAQDLLNRALSGLPSLRIPGEQQPPSPDDYPSARRRSDATLATRRAGVAGLRAQRRSGRRRTSRCAAAILERTLAHSFVSATGLPDFTSLLSFDVSFSVPTLDLQLDFSLVDPLANLDFRCPINVSASCSAGVVLSSASSSLCSRS